MPAPMVADALAKGAVDATVLSPSGLFQFGTPAIVRNHYLLTTGTAPLVVLMSRKRFESLPDAAKAIIRKHSGDRAAAAWIDSYGGSEARALAQVRSEPGRKVVDPSAADQETALRVYNSLIEVYAEKSEHTRRLMAMITSELAALRSGSR
jgi:TRAP-type C4-dicarboxylate transport system substrate-binding protein